VCGGVLDKSLDIAESICYWDRINQFTNFSRKVNFSHVRGLMAEYMCTAGIYFNCHNADLISGGHGSFSDLTYIVQCGLRVPHVFNGKAKATTKWRGFLNRELMQMILDFEM